MLLVLFFFFFQAEDGIRDIGVTGVQTCALPILGRLCESKKLRQGLGRHVGMHDQGDRKSTRLNSSHANISYAVFCLKKKKNKNDADSNTEHVGKYNQILRIEEQRAEVPEYLGGS